MQGCMELSVVEEAYLFRCAMMIPICCGSKIHREADVQRRSGCKVRSDTRRHVGESREAWVRSLYIRRWNSATRSKAF
ncbi:hypothetical protein QJS04_geneDACA009433 [Acorus gramineus]|uniref:Uncharacterized protein n=1 Tax=Acorus gramineus TaxID=55184 RepID=A0AAV9AG63_ACOGR|nr:hypothetical protein QJS04_geneDACA009433 [Acorus gramineus]